MFDAMGGGKMLTSTQMEEILLTPFLVARAEPRVGERIGIKYLGFRKARGGDEYRDFNVVVDRPSENPDWSSQPESADTEDQQADDAEAENQQADAEDERASDAEATDDGDDDGVPL